MRWRSSKLPVGLAQVPDSADHLQTLFGPVAVDCRAGHLSSGELDVEIAARLRKQQTSGDPDDYVDKLISSPAASESTGPTASISAASGLSLLVILVVHLLCGSLLVVNLLLLLVAHLLSDWLVLSLSAAFVLLLSPFSSSSITLKSAMGLTCDDVFGFSR